MTKDSLVAFIPARSGSKRISGKNIKLLNGHPLMAYSINACIKSKIFKKIYCITDNPLYADIAMHYGAEVPALRPKKISGDKSTDYEWLSWISSTLESKGEIYDYFGIIRPTNPIRNFSTIRRAWNLFKSNKKADSLRAVQLCSEHPAKMWRIRGEYMNPIIENSSSKYPMHSMQYSSLEETYVQNASLEIACTSVIKDHRNISGDKILPFISKGYEGFDLNKNEDWFLLEKLIEKKIISLDSIRIDPFKF